MRDERIDPAPLDEAPETGPAFAADLLVAKAGCLVTGDGLPAAADLAVRAGEEGTLAGEGGAVALAAAAAESPGPFLGVSPPL